MTNDRGQSELVSSGGAPTVEVDVNQLVNSTDSQLDEMFLRSETLPLDRLMNVGEHRIDVATETIYNDEAWKGWLPKGLPVRDLFARLSTGYSKRFWKQGKAILGETLYVEGRVRVKHSLEEFTLDRFTNDLPPGRYILLRYTEAVFENLFYDVFRALTDGVILYRGYTGRFPEGKRGLSAPLIRRYTFGQMGVKDHQRLFQDGRIPPGDSLRDEWSIDAITTADRPTRIARLSVAKHLDGRSQSVCEPVASPETPVPSFLLDHFRCEDFSERADELRMINDRTVVGKWTTDLRGSYPKLLLVGSPGLFHTEREKGRGRRFTMYYVLTRG